MTLSFAVPSEDETKEMARLSRFYWDEARRCKDAKAYLAGCVMLGSALETLLILVISVHAEEADRTNKVPRKSGTPKPLLKWNLAELIAVAKAAKWLPAELDLRDEWDSKKARIGDYAEVARMVRNLAHPARYIAEHPRGRVTKKYLEYQFEIVLGCRNWLRAHNNRELLKLMNEEEEKAR